MHMHMHMHMHMSHAHAHAHAHVHVAPSRERVHGMHSTCIAHARHTAHHACVYAYMPRSGLVACLLTTADHITTAAAELRRQQVPSADPAADPAAEEHDKAAQRSAPNPLSGNGQPRAHDRGSRGPDAATAGALGAPRAVEADGRGADKVGGYRWMHDYRSVDRSM